MTTIWGLLTLLVCAIGLVSVGRRASLFSDPQGQVELRLFRVFTSDASLYFVTLFFGLATLFNWQLDNVLYPLRLVCLIVNIKFGLDLTKKLRATSREQ